MDLGGQVINRSQGSEELSESVARKLEDLVKRVKKMLDEDRKRSQEQESEKDKNLHKIHPSRISGIHEPNSINKSIEPVLGGSETKGW